MRKATKEQARETEKVLNSLGRDLAKAVKNRNNKKLQSMIGIIQGSKDLAKKIGIHCDCDIRKLPMATTPLTKCICEPSAAALTRRRIGTRKEGAVLHYFQGLGAEEGEGCRDGSGRFIPTDACRGPVGRDAAGRFVSLRPL